MQTQCTSCFLVLGGLLFLWICGNQLPVCECNCIQGTEKKLMCKQESGKQANQAAFDIIPTTQHILDNYNVLTTEEKNRLWKLVLRKVTAYRTPEGELSVHIYPKLPKVI